MVKEKEIIGYAIKQDFDFGMLSEKSRKGTIKVSKDIWVRYVNLRYDFEVMHQSLIDKVGDICKVNKLLKDNSKTLIE